jgi:hypothetical protein
MCPFGSAWASTHAKIVTDGMWLLSHTVAEAGLFTSSAWENRRSMTAESHNDAAAAEVPTAAS